jgi:PAS domain S-box-containing protein
MGNAAVYLCAGAAVVYFLALVVTGAQPTHLTAAGVMAGLNLGALALLFLGAPKAAAKVTLSIIGAGVIYGLISTGGASAPAASTVTVVALLAGQVIGARGALLVGVVGVIVFLLIPFLGLPPEPVTGERLTFAMALTVGTGGALAALGARDAARAVARLRDERAALRAANDTLARRAREQEALARIGQLMVEGESASQSFQGAVGELAAVWGGPVALFGRGDEGPVIRAQAGFSDPGLEGGDDEAARCVAHDGPTTATVVDGERTVRCTAVAVRSGTLPHGVLVAAKGARVDGDEDPAVLVGAAALLAAAFEWADATGRMRAAERRRAALVKSSPDAILILDELGVIVDANPATNRLFGQQSTRLVGRSLAEIDALSADDLATLARAMKEAHQSGTVDGIGLSWKLPAGALIHAEARVNWVREGESGSGRFDIALRDISARVEATQKQERLESQLYAARRLEGLGQLAGGVAHDFNNLLSVILTNAMLISERPDLDDELRADLREITDCGKRAADLTGQLLAFARQQRREPRLIEPNTIILGMEKLLRRLTPANVKLELLLDPDVGRTLVDPAQLEQVVVNLIANARDALGEQGGTVTITTRDVVWTEDTEDTEANGPPLGERVGETMTGDFVGDRPTPGAWCEITVADNGAGMDDETRGRVFEPFFTTKPVGRGSGLGLATVYGIVRQSGGFISVQSAPGAGTCFRVWLPRPPDNAQPFVEQQTPVGGDALGNERVLVVDDDDAVRRATERALSSRGFQVTTAASAEAALALLEGHSLEIDAVVTDLVMPGLLGDQLVAALRTQRPDLPAILLTGYGRRSAELSRPFRLLRKPTAPEELARALRSVLDERESRPGSPPPPDDAPRSSGLLTEDD